MPHGAGDARTRDTLTSHLVPSRRVTLWSRRRPAQVTLARGTDGFPPTRPVGHALPRTQHLPARSCAALGEA